MFIWLYLTLGLLIGCICLDKLDKWLKIISDNPKNFWEIVAKKYQHKKWLKYVFLIVSVIVWLPVVIYGLTSVIYSIINLSDDDFFGD